MRRVPTNYVLLSLFTFFESVVVGFVSAQYTQESVVIAMGITALVVVSLTIFACQTKMDFTGFGPYLFCLVHVVESRPARYFSINREKLDLEYKIGIRGDDPAGAVRAIPIVGSHGEDSLFTQAHLGHALIPTFDHLSDSDLRLKRLASVHARVELFTTIFKGAGVVHRDRVALLGIVGFVALLQDLFFDAHRRNARKWEDAERRVLPRTFAG